jgi:hypothetical protein
MTPLADLVPSGVSTSTVSRYLWPGRLILTWSPITSTANSANGPSHLEITLKFPLIVVLALHDGASSVKRARVTSLIPGTFGERVLLRERGSGDQRERGK